MLTLLACTHDDPPPISDSPDAPAAECIATSEPTPSMECTPICDDGCTVDLSADSVHLSGTVSFGGTASREPTDAYTVRFTGGEHAYTSEVHDDAWSVDLPTGTYDIALSDFPLEAGVAVTEDAELALVAEAYHLSGTLTYGDAPMNGVSAVTATEQTTGASYVSLSSRAFSLTVPPGTYDIYWTYDYQFVYLAAGVPVTGDTTHDVALPLVMLSGAVTDEGQVPSVDYSVSLLEPGTGRFLTAAGSDGTYALPAPPGTYDVYLTLSDAYVSIPVATDVALTEDTTLDLDAHLVTVTGTDSFGRAWPDTDYEVVFTDADTGLRWMFDGDLGAWSAEIPPADYVVTLWVPSGACGPDGTIPIGTYTIDTDTTLHLTPSLVTVEGAVTYNGVPATDYTVSLSSADGEWYYCSGDDGNYTLTVPPGDYEIYVTYELDAVTTLDVPIATESLSTDTSFDLSACTETVTGTATLDGAPPDAFLVYLTEIDTGLVYAGRGTEGTYTVVAPPGIYDLSFYTTGTFPSGSCVTID